MTAHHLDPLTGEEVARAAEITRAQGGLDETAWFETITLDEPLPGTTGPRRVYVCCYEHSSGRTMTGFADLEAGALVDWRHQEGAQARIVADEFVAADPIIKADPRVVEALALRGVTDLDKVLIEVWAAGHFGVKEEEGERLAYCHIWVANEAGDNRYGRPVAGLHPVYDLRNRKVVRVDDFGVHPLPPDSAPIRREEGLREGLKRIDIAQPDGPSFEVDGWQVRWQNWRIRIGHDLREGLVLHDIGYEDQGRLRPIMRRASMPEMVVPYGDPRPGEFRRNAFDTGEYGLGGILDSLKLGCDCLGHIRYFDLWAHDWDGSPRKIENAVCMHEEDFGLLWKHTDTYSGIARSARSRRLVISSIATIGNYVYGFFWYFYLDGTIGVEIKATGIPFPSGASAEGPSEWGRLVAPGIESHVHQHIFSFRFEMAVDGEKNRVKEVEFEAAPPGPENPQGNAIHTIERLLGSEKAAARPGAPERARSWKVESADQVNGLGQPTAYRLAPGVNAAPMLHPEAPVAKRAGFIFNQFWATRWAKEERYPAGWFPNQHPGGDGLPAWVERDGDLDGTDLVVWHTVNFHHLPRPEDWPVQPVVYANFHWMAEGFFDENPAMDVPPNDRI